MTNEAFVFTPDPTLESRFYKSSEPCFFIIIQIKQPARSPEVDDVFRVNAVYMTKGS